MGWVKERLIGKTAHERDVATSERQTSRLEPEEIVESEDRFGPRAVAPRCLNVLRVCAGRVPGGGRGVERAVLVRRVALVA